MWASLPNITGTSYFFERRSISKLLGRACFFPRDGFSDELYREREKLVRAYEHLKSEIATYENNIGFLTSSSKKGGGLIREMERKIEALKDESKLIEQKINLLDEKV
jgi:hypothetical protein